jgi:hypothetical protein
MLTLVTRSWLLLCFGATVFKVADSGRQGRISWEDFKVFETRKCGMSSSPDFALSSVC